MRRKKAARARNASTPRCEDLLCEGSVTSCGLHGRAMRLFFPIQREHASYLDPSRRREAEFEDRNAAIARAQSRRFLTTTNERRSVAPSFFFLFLASRFQGGASPLGFRLLSPSCALYSRDFLLPGALGDSNRSIVVGIFGARRRKRARIEEARTRNSFP